MVLDITKPMATIVTSKIVITPITRTLPIALELLTSLFKVNPSCHPVCCFDNIKSAVV